MSGEAESLDLMKVGFHHSERLGSDLAVTTWLPYLHLYTDCVRLDTH